jgi:hypothetical protein
MVPGVQPLLSVARRWGLRDGHARHACELSDERDEVIARERLDGLLAFRLRAA